MKGHFYIRGSVFPVDVLVSIGEPDLNLRRTCKRYGVHKDKNFHRLFQKDSFIRATTVIMEGKQVVIRFFQRPTPGEIAHECLHTVFMILESVGIEYSHKSEETYTYFLGYLVDRVFENIKKM